MPSRLIEDEDGMRARRALMALDRCPPVVVPVGPRQIICANSVID